MSTSFPSTPITIADVPEVSKFPQPQFVYNYYVENETVDETGEPPAGTLRRSTSYMNDGSNLVQYARRMPRHVKIAFSPVVISSVSVEKRKNSSYIRSNESKIVHEEHFSNNKYTGVNFEPVDVETKLFALVSGTAASIGSSSPSLERTVSAKSSLAEKVGSATSEEVPPGFLSKVMASRVIQDHTIRAHDPVPPDLSLRVQFDNRFVKSAVQTSMFDPFSIYNEDVRSLWTSLQEVQRKAISSAKSTVIHSKEFDPEVQWISVEKQTDTTTPGPLQTKIVGYIVDKWEISSDGTFKSVKPSIILENPLACEYLDFSVKYGCEYCYAVRAIAEIRVSMLVESTDGSSAPSIVTLLVSSRPTPKQYVQTIEKVAPPPPTDVDFVWNFQDRLLSVVWSFPVNTQRDIKKFQVFRRRDVSSPFELLQLIDFSDPRAAKFPDPESDMLPASVVKRVTSPVTMFVDEEFTRDSEFIYAIAAVDAHGLASPYSQQFKVSFDKFRNKLIREQISPSGAPKPYPNYHLLVDTFADVIHSTKKQTVSVYFTPDAVSIIDRANAKRQMLETDITGGKYYLQVTNTDLQKQRVCEISVADLRTTVGSPSAVGKFLGDISTISAARPRFG